MDWWDDPRLKGSPDPDFWVTFVCILGGVLLAVAAMILI